MMMEPGFQQQSRGKPRPGPGVLPVDHNQKQLAKSFPIHDNHFSETNWRLFSWPQPQPMCHKASDRFNDVSTRGHRAIMTENYMDKLNQGRIATGDHGPNQADEVSL